MITQSELKELLHYDPDTGLFLRCGKKVGRVLNCGSKKRYIGISLKSKTYRAHRLAWLYVYGKFPSGDIDHINGNGFDNRIKNLRDVDRQTNMRNSRRKSTNKSGVTGVTWDSKRLKWYASIMVGYKTISLGRHDDIKDAIAARKNAELKYGFHPNHGSDRPL